MSSRTGRLALAHLWVAIVAFGVASAMALMQALSRAALGACGFPLAMLDSRTGSRPRFRRRDVKKPRESELPGLARSVSGKEAVHEQSGWTMAPG